MRLYHQVLVHFGFVFVLVFHSVASPCIGVLNSNPTEIQSSSLEYSAGAVKDFLSVPFPRFKYERIRPITPREVQEAVVQFYSYVSIFEQFSKTLRDGERQVLVPALKVFMNRIGAFAGQYRSFERTSSVLNRVHALSNQLKGVAFERMVAVLLMRRGYPTVIVDEASKKRLLNSIYGNRKIDFEIDVIAIKDGLTYFVEAKSIRPLENEHLAAEIESVSRQMASRKMRLSAINSNHHVRNIIIAHFNLGEDVRAEWLKAGADEVFYLRREYLDDFTNDDLYR